MPAEGAASFLREVPSVSRASVETVAGYDLVEPLGSGALGIVWEARDPEGRAVALKFLDCRTRHRDLIAREVRLLRALGELQHPHIIRLLSVHPCSRHLVLVMEKADGNLEHLRQAYQHEAKVNVPPDHALELLGQAAEALDVLADLSLPGLHVSSRGLQHCDVKPSNLLLLGGSLKVADFGLCVGPGWQTHTKGGWRGTWPYAAPEQYHGRPAPGTDQYALAITDCELVMGDRPFWKDARPGEPPSGRLPIDLGKVREREVPVLARALHPQPSLRYPSCRAFVAALSDAALAPRPPRAPAVAAPG
jgi:serine/threonine protein kinase